MKRTIQHFFITLLLLPVLTFGQACFYPKVNYPVQTNPYSLTKADFNSDGNTDLAVSNQGSNNIYLLFGNGAGSFTTTTNFSVNVYPDGISSADFNSDGNSDLAVAIPGSNIITIFLGNGAGSFTTATNFTLNANSGPVNISIADLNKDSKLDLVTSNLSSKNVSVLLGDGLGSFSGLTDYTVGTGLSVNAMQTVIEDFNGDSNLDLATITQYSGVSILLGNGLGGFSASTNFGAGNNPLSITSADFNGDGKKDLAVSNNGSSDISILIGDGLGNFANAINYSTGSGPNYIISDDFNNDGKIDLITANQSSSVSFLKGNGSGDFAPPANFGVGSDPICIISGDFDGDSKLDFATANYLSANVSILLFKTAPIPAITAISSSTALCAGETATLTASGASTYTWNTAQTTSTIIISPTVTTTYVVNGTDANGCINFSLLTQSVSACIGINEIFSVNNSISIYPNPSNGEISVKAPIKMGVSIINEFGQVVNNIELEDTPIKIDNLSNGIYFLVGQKENHYIRQKFIIVNSAD